MSRLYDYEIGKQSKLEERVTSLKNLAEEKQIESAALKYEYRKIKELKESLQAENAYLKSLLATAAAAAATSAQSPQKTTTNSSNTANLGLIAAMQQHHHQQQSTSPSAANNCNSGDVMRRNLSAAMSSQSGLSPYQGIYIHYIQSFIVSIESFFTI